MSRRERTAMMSTTRASEGAFVAVSSLVFAASAVITIALGSSMSSGMPMPVGWTMSTAWMRMPGQAWTAMAASFVAMWVVMMVAMMMPSLVPMLWRYREAVPRNGEARLGGLTACVGVAYFGVWAVLGIAIFPLGFALAS